MAGQITLTNSGTTPPSPASGSVTIFTSTVDKQLYSIDDTGAVAGPFGFTLSTSSDVRIGTSSTTVMTPSAFRGGALVSATTQTTTSGTSIDFTGIPSWAKRIVVMLSGVSTSGTSLLLLQIGDSGGVENTGYLGTSQLLEGSGAAANMSAGFSFNDNTAAAADVRHGAITLSLLDSSTNTWVANGFIGFSNIAAQVFVSGSKALSATLDRVRLTTVNGTDTFDAGLVNIIYE